MNSLINEPVVDLIMRAKSRMPAGWKITTIEEEYWLILHIDLKEFNRFSIGDRIRIAETTNELCEKIKETGCPCYIQKA
jgi:hypothetical protein